MTEKVETTVEETEEKKRTIRRWIAVGATSLGATLGIAALMALAGSGEDESEEFSDDEEDDDDVEVEVTIEEV